MNKKNWIVAVAFSVLCMAGAEQIQAQKVYKEGEAIVIDFGPDTGFPQRAVETKMGMKNESNDGVWGKQNSTVYKKLEIGKVNDVVCTYFVALRTCQQANTNGVTGWRLPTLTELAVIHSFRKAILALSPDFTFDCFIWSFTRYSTSSVSEAYIMGLDPDKTGGVREVLSKNTLGSSAKVRCVREIP